MITAMLWRPMLLLLLELAASAPTTTTHEDTVVARDASRDLRDARRLNSMVRLKHTKRNDVNRQQSTRCDDDPSYVDMGWNCASWAGFDCAFASAYGYSAEQAAQLVQSCPECARHICPCHTAAARD